MTASAPAAGLVHGMGKDLVQPDWPPLTEAEARAVLARYPRAGLAGPDLPGGPDLPTGALPPAEITWRSPRPFSAAALVREGAATVFIKRHHRAVRTTTQLEVEHAFADHLRASGLQVPTARRTIEGTTAVIAGHFVYEVHDRAAGLDLYRHATSWSPFASLGHAREAGAALARLHRAAAGFSEPARIPGVLISSAAVISAADPLAELEGLLGERPGLAGYLSARAWHRDFARDLLPRIARAAPLLARLAPQWAHGDWHPSNLTWDSAGLAAKVAGVFDFGLANRTFAVHDLAVAVERATISWLDLAESGQAVADLDSIDALIAGYESVRRLRRAEAAALAEVLPVSHVEYALSEVEYFASVIRSPALADLAYDGYLLGHARWFDSPAGARVLDHLRRRAVS